MMEAIYKRLPSSFLIYSALYFRDSVFIPSPVFKWLNHVKRTEHNPWAIELLILYRVQNGDGEEAKQLYRENRKQLQKHLERTGRREAIEELLKCLS
jgi:hypothetical protein